jgi:hypothetical protein
MKSLKTAWEHYNNATEITDRERKQTLVEQMDTVLIFVRPGGGVPCLLTDLTLRLVCLLAS